MSDDGSTAELREQMLQQLDQLMGVRDPCVRYATDPYTPLEERSAASFDESARLADIRETRLKRCRPWGAEEAEMLARLRGDGRRLSYEQVAQRLNRRFGNRRTAKEAQQRWTRVQDPRLHKGPWGEAEDRQLLRLARELRGCVRDIRKQMPQRTVVQIRARLRQLRREGR